MAEAKHTPGTWLHAHRAGSDGMFNTQVFTEDGETIATLHWYPMPTTPQGVTGTYREGNARLISSAPDLLAAAIKALDECVDLIETPAGNALRAAIAKAVQP